MFRWLTCLAALLFAPAATASEFSLRVEPVPADGVRARVSLVESCTSYECGRAAVSAESFSQLQPAHSLEVVLGAHGIIRGETPEDRDGWWVVVETSDHLPLAMLWRPPVAEGHLPSVPLVQKERCRVAVVDGDGGAVPGATVTAIVSEPPVALEPPVVERPTVFPAWLPWLRPVRTDGEGRAVLDVPADGEVALHVTVHRYASAAAPCRPNEVTRVTVSRASVRTFRVQDPSGRPLPGALARDGLGMPVAVSNAEGAIELDLTTIEAAVRGAGSAPFWFETTDGAVHELAEHRAADDIRLSGELQIRGFVVGPGGDPVPDATVWAAGSNTSLALSRPATDAGPKSGIAARFDTDRYGAFVVPGLPLGASVDLEISARGFATERRFEVPPTESEPFKVTLYPEAVIAGRVTLGGQGIQTRLTALDQEGNETSWPTNDEGRFRSTGLAEGRYNLVAYPPGAMVLIQFDDSEAPPLRNRLTLMSDGPGEEVRASVQANSGETVKVDLEVGVSKRRLLGQVSEHGVGLPGVAIRVEGRSATMTDGDGRYSFEGLPSGLAWVTADRRHNSIGSAIDTLEQTVVIDSKSQRLDFDFSVFDVSGRAVQGDGSAAAAIEIVFERVDNGHAYRERTMTRGDGSFDVRLAPGDYHVRSQGVHTGGSSTRVQGRQLVSRDNVRVAGNTSDVLVRFGHSLRLSGEVHGLSEAELERLRVETVSDDRPLCTRSSTRGRMEHRSRGRQGRTADPCRAQRHGPSHLALKRAGIAP